MRNIQFPELYQLFGGYFNQDYDLWGDTSEEVFDSYLRSVSNRHVDQLVEEIDTLLADSLRDEELDRAVYDDLGLEYVPTAEGRTVREWLVGLRTRALEPGSPRWSGTW